MKLNYNYAVNREFNSPGLFLSKKAISCLRTASNNLCLIRLTCLAAAILKETFEK